VRITYKNHLFFYLSPSVVKDHLACKTSHTLTPGHFPTGRGSRANRRHQDWI